MTIIIIIFIFCYYPFLQFGLEEAGRLFSQICGGEVVLFFSDGLSSCLISDLVILESYFFRWLGEIVWSLCPQWCFAGFQKPQRFFLNHLGLSCSGAFAGLVFYFGRLIQFNHIDSILVNQTNDVPPMSPSNRESRDGQNEKKLQHVHLL